MKNVVFFSLFVLANFLGTNSFYSQNAHTIFSLKVVGIEAGEWFSFKDNLGRETSTNHSGTFNLGGFSQGSRYEISQKNGTRNCKLIYNEGTVTATPMIVVANCTKEAPTPSTILSLKTTGIEVGEWFTFKDNLGRETSVNHSTTSNLGGFTQGSQYNITQTKGSRNCKLSLNEGTVSSNAVTVLANCSKTSVTPSNPANPTTNNNEANPTVPKNKIDLVTRNSENTITNTFVESSSPSIGGKGEDEGRFVALMMFGNGIDGSDGKFRQIYWRDRKTGETKLISKANNGEQGNKDSFAPSISADGNSVVFESYATNFSENDNNRTRDIFLWQKSLGTVSLISKSSQNIPSNGESFEPVISGDGKTVAFTSYASDITDLGSGFNTPNVFVHQISSGSTDFITKDFENGKASGGSAPSISENGKSIAFYSNNHRLVENDNNKLWDIFLWKNGNVKRISVPNSGMERNQGNESTSRIVYPSISGDGEKVVFATTSSTLVENDTNTFQDIFLYDVQNSSLKRISTLENNTESNGDSPILQGGKVGISFDGKWISYNTNASNLAVSKGNIIVQNTENKKIFTITNTSGIGTGNPVISRKGNFVAVPANKPLDSRFSSSGIFTIYTNINP